MAQEEKETLAFLKNKGWVLPQEKVIKEVDKKSDALKFLESKGWLPALQPPPIPPAPPVQPSPILPPQHTPFQEHQPPLISDSPRIGLKEILAEVPGVLKMRPIGKLAEKEFWQNIPKNLLQGAWDFVSGMTHAIMPAAGPGQPRFAAYMPPKTEEEPSAFDVIKAGAEPITGLITFLPRTAFEFAKNPIKTMEEKPFDLLFLFSAVLGPKFINKAKAKIKAKADFTGTELRSFVEEIPEKIISTEQKSQIIEKIPKDIKISPKGEVSYRFFPKDAPQIWRDVMDATNGQGIRPFKDPVVKGKFLELEEYRSAVPKQLRRKNGLPPDEVADMLGFESSQELYNALEWSGKKPVMEKPIEVIEAEAEAFEGIQKDALLEEIAREKELRAERGFEVREEKPAAVKPVEAMAHAKEAVSVEALSRQKVQSFYLYDSRSQALKPLIGVDAVDILPKPHEAKVVVNKKTGGIDYVDYGQNLSASVKPLIEKQLFKVKGVREPADLFGKEIEEVKAKAEAPKAEEARLFEPTEIEAKYPAGFDSRGIRTVPDINKAREIAQSHVDKGWKLEVGQSPENKGWIRLIEEGKPGEGELNYIAKARKPEFFKKTEVEYEIPEKRPKIVAQERELERVIGEKVEIGKPPPEAAKIEGPLEMMKLKNRADESFTYEEFLKAVEKKEANAMVKKAGFKSLKNFWEESQEVREYKVRPELLKKKKPEKIEIKEKEITGVEEKLEEAGIAEEAKVGKGELSLPYKEWQKSAEGGFVSTEFGKTFGGSKKSAVYQALLDRFHAIKGLTDIVKKEGIELPVHKDPYMSVRNYLGVQGKAETKLMYKRFTVDNKGYIRFKGESLVDILDPVKKNIDEFERYLVDRRVPELEGRGIETGRDLRAATDFIRENRDRFEPAARKFTEFHHSLLDELVEAGFMTKEKGRIIKDHNQMYAPFNRVVEDLNNYGYIPSSNKLLSKITSPLKRIKGSERAIISPLESTVKATYSVTNIIERNRIANMIIDMRKMSPELARTIKPVKPQMVVVATLKDGTKVYRPSTYQKAGVIEVLTKGKRHFYEVPPDLYEAMSQLTEVGHNWLVKILAAPARILRTGATTTPEFAFRNPVRDNWFAFVNAKYGFIPGWDFAKGMFSLVKKPELYWKWKAAGGEWSMLVTLDRASNQATLKNVLGVKDYKKYMKNPLAFLEEVSMYGEMPTRLGVFERAAGKVSDLEAAFESREGSIDFARRGAKTKTVSALYTFANARLQALDKFARTFKEAPVKTSAKIMAVAVIPSIINYLMNRDDETYWEIPQWQRDMFWIIPIKRGKAKVKTVLKEEEKEARKGKKGFYLRIPKGDVGVIFGTTVEKVLEWIDKDKEGKAELDKLAVSIIKECLPVSDVGGFLPVAFRVPVEIMTNKKFFYDRPIVSEGKQKLERKYQYSPFTSESAKAVGKVFNISPSKVEHLVTGYGAGLARHALKLTDGVLAEMGILAKKAEIPKELADYPGVAAFAVRDPIGFGSESVQRFYETLGKFEKFEATSKMMKDKKMSKERIAWAKKHTAEFLASEGKLVTDFRRARQDLSSLRKMKEKVLANKEITVEQKEQITDEIHGLVMATVISLLSQYRALEQIADKRKKK